MLAGKKSLPYGDREYFSALDGFRGLLALFVAVYHTVWFSNTNALTFFQNGTVMIDLFFALSGFLMFHIYDGKLNNGSDAKDFLKRRFARLYPLHIFMLAVFVIFLVMRLVAHKIGIATHDVGEVLPFTPGAEENWFSLLSHLTLTHAIGVNNSLTFNYPAWTISAEFFAYFLFVLIMLKARPVRFFHFLILGVIAALIYAILSLLKPNMDITYDYAVLRCIAGFFIGMISAKCYVKVRQSVISMKSSTRYSVFSILEIFIVVSSVLFIIFCGGSLQFYVGPFLLAFIFIFAFDGGIVSSVMSAKPFHYLAKISYSTYMTHVIISICFDIFSKVALAKVFPNWNEGWGGDLLLLVYLGVVIAVSHFTYHLVEVPGGKFIRNFDFGKVLKSKSKSA